MEAVDAGAEKAVAAPSPSLPLVPGVVAGAAVAADGVSAGVGVLAELAQGLLPAVTAEGARRVQARPVVAGRVPHTLVYVL